MLELMPESHCEGNITPLDWTLLKRLLRFPPTFGQNLVVLFGSLVGILLLTAYEWFYHGLTLHVGLAIALLAALSAATGMLIYQERHSWAQLKELRAVHDTEMLHAEHLATMGELAAGVAHEIRNPLAGIAGAIEIISKDFPKDHPDREILEDLREEVRRIEKVLNDMLGYARPKPPQFGLADLREAVARTIQLARQQTGIKRIEIAIQIPPALPKFRMDPEQLHQVLLNLVLNGIQAIEREGKITIAAQMVSSAATLKRPDQIEISVSDTGVGIPMEQIERIFRPFYTTKRGGTGLGLSLCRRIISLHGGTLTAESEINKGSRFIIRLPIREAVEEPRGVYAQ